MKTLNRWVYAAVGVVVLLLAGLVYAWTTMASVINRDLGIDQAPLSLTFTITMAMFCVGCLIAGILSKKVGPKVYVLISAVLFIIGFFVASLTDGVALLYIGFGVLAGLASGFAYNAVAADKLSEIASEYVSAESCGSLDKAVGKATAEALINNGIVVVCGSLYLASEYFNSCEN